MKAKIAEWLVAQRTGRQIALGLALGLCVATGAATPWDDVLLQPAPKTFPAPADITNTANKVQSILLEGEMFEGRSTRIFAWYGLPKGASAAQKCPAMVLIHGGAGTAYAWWVELWNKRGYAAIAMDTCGALPVREKDAKTWKRSGVGGPAGWGGFGEIDRPLKDQWTYHAVAAVIRANTFLRSLPEVDKQRVGVTGISWGGYLTCIVAGVDPRYGWAVPVYGCGFYGDDSEWTPLLKKMAARGEKWLAQWDASVYLAEATCPMLWVSGTKDRFFKVPMLQKSAACAKGPQYFDIRETMVHGHNAGSAPEEILSFADYFAFGKPLHPNITDHWAVRPENSKK